MFPGGLLRRLRRAGFRDGGPELADFTLSGLRKFLTVCRENHEVLLLNLLFPCCDMVGVQKGDTTRDLRVHGGADALPRVIRFLRGLDHDMNIA